MRRFLLAVSICLAFTTPGWAIRLEGRVVLGDEPLSGMHVQAFPDLNPNSKTLAPEAISAEDGSFHMDLPTGYAALYAKSSDGKYFAFCGRNPLLIQGQEKHWAGLQASKVSPLITSPYDDEYSSGLEGIVMHAGKPVADAYVSLYLDVAEDLKGQGYRLSAPTGADGYFAFDGLPESSYFLVARKRLNGARVGPVAVGDMLGVFAGNPLELKSGEYYRVSIPLVKRQPGSSFVAGPNRKGDILLRGQVLNENDLPVAGVHAFAYRNAVIGHQRPVSISPATGEDGHFEMTFKEAGLYYIGAREAYGDSPAPGELFGLYEGRADHGMVLEESSNSTILIHVAPIQLD